MAFRFSGKTLCSTRNGCLQKLQHPALSPRQLQLGQLSNGLLTGDSKDPLGVLSAKAAGLLYKALNVHAGQTISL